MYQRDLLIAGGGPVGATLALALREAPFGVCLCEARAPNEPPRTDRVLALSHGSRLILERLGVWSRLVLAPGGLNAIERVAVSQESGAAELLFSATELGLPALGYVVSYRDLVGALDAALLESGCALQWQARVRSVRGTANFAWYEIDAACPSAGTARLIALADGGPGADAWRRDYKQLALQCELEVSQASGLAIERFAAQGPIALLPRGQRHALVWTLPEAMAQETLALDDQAFLARLSTHFGAAPHRFSAPGPRRVQPLSLRVATRAAQRRIVRLGNAAQTLHPIAAQGYNLGLRDAFALARGLLDDAAQELGSERQLRRYVRERSSDRWGTILATHGIVELFGVSSPRLAGLRDQGMQLLSRSALLRRAASQVLMHGWR